MWNCVNKSKDKDIDIVTETIETILHWVLDLMENALKFRTQIGWSLRVIGGDIL